MKSSVKVLVVDDSAMVRKLLSEALSEDPLIEVVATAADPYEARELILKHNPDVLTLDIDMPRMDGLTFLKILRQHRPMPVIVISSLTQTGSAVALEALNSGAIDVLAKPANQQAILHMGELLRQRVRAAATAQILKRTTTSQNPNQDNTPIVPSRSGHRFHPRQVICIGSSTGGVQALTEILPRLPIGLPGIAIVQHMPAHFSKVFSDRLNAQSAIEVKEAEDGDMLLPGMAILAPGDYHMTLQWAGTGYRVSLNQGPPVHHCRPAVDVLFRSIADIPGAKVLSAILTGMGTDGALGMKTLKAIGARTLAQNEATSVVYGMPRAAAELKVVDRILPLEQFASAIQEECMHISNKHPSAISPLAHPIEQKTSLLQHVH